MKSGSRDSLEPIVDARALLGECPVWSPVDARLYWIDIDGRAIHSFEPSTGAQEARTTPGRPGSIALTAERGRLLAAMEHELGWFAWESGDYVPWVALEPAGTGNRLNDGRCDPAGRFWVGSMYERAAADRFTGFLHRVERDGTAAIVRGEVGVSNGLAFSPDGETMYWADTLHDVVWSYDYDISTGAAQNERVFVDFTDHPGRPDGACVDEDGCYWVACVHGGALARFSPTGALDRLIEVPTTRPTMPAFGNANLDVMYVTTIGAGGSHEADPGDPHAGGLFAIEVGVRGLPEPVFAG